MPLFLVFFVLAVITTTVWPSENAITVHLVILPSAVIYSSICPLIDPSTVDVVLEEVSRVCRAVCPCESSPSLLLPVYVVP